MIKTIKNLISKFFCLHQWELMKSITMRDISFGEPLYSGTIKQCRCSKCGKWKSFRIK